MLYTLIILFLIILILFICYYYHHYSQQTCKYDYIVCGLGSAGAIIASELAKRGYKVLGIERGQNENNNEIVRNAQFPTIAASTNNLSTSYLADGIPTEVPPFSKRNEFVQGKMWGGSTGVNYLARVRPDKEWHKKLSELVNDNAFTYESFLPYYKETETYIGETQNPEERGESGKIKITQQRIFNKEYEDWFQNLSEASGVEMLEDYNTGDALVSSQYFQRSFYYDEDENMIRSWSGIYLEDLSNNITILSNSNVSRVLFKNNTAIGVEVMRGKGCERYYCEKEVIVCNGLESSCLLERSGIGDREILDKYSIPVVYENKEVGRNFYDHVGATPFVQLNDDLSPYAFSVVLSHVDDGGFTKENERNLEYLFAQVNYGDHFPQMTLPIYCATWNLNPKIRGTIHIGGPGMSEPIINLNDKEDLRVVARYIINILNPYLTSTGTGSILIPDDIIGDEDELINYLWNFAFTRGYHYVGQCSMGKVVDSKLRVIGVDKLRVIDNSIYPIIPPCHTSITAQALGFYGIDVILG